MSGATLTKAQATACAMAALEGILATAARDDRGRPTIVLTQVWGLPGAASSTQRTTACCGGSR